MATFTVTNANDSGAGSLRQAVRDANAAAGADTIVFGAGFDGGAENVIRLTSGQIRIREALTIDGGDGVTITGDAAGNDRTDADGTTDVAASGARRLDDNSRIFDASADLTLDGLTLTGGRTTGDAVDFEDPLRDGGGAVRVADALVLSNSTVSGNSTAGAYAPGGGIYAASVRVINSNVTGNSTAGVGASGGGLVASDVTVTNSMVTGNSTAGEIARGAGIVGGSVSVTNSTVSGNSSMGRSADGGGILGGSITVRNSTVSGNSTLGELAGGGGIDGSYVIVKNSVVSGNSTGGDGGAGGGIYADYTVRVTNSTVSGNSTIGRFASGGGIDGTDVIVKNSTVRNNSTDGDSAAGGGIFGHRITVRNSSVSDNNTAGASANGGGINALAGSVFLNSSVSGNNATGNRAAGGGIASYSATVTNSTVSGNTATTSGGGIFASSGFYEDEYGSIRLTNSVVLGNAASIADPDEVSGGADLSLAGGNIVGGDIFSGMTDVGDTSARQVFDRTVVIADGVLAGRLADNGGPTRTIALNLDVTNPALGGAKPGKAPGTDQRGEPRDAAPDLGAFEAAPVDGVVLVGGRRPDALTGAGMADQLYGRSGGDELRGRADDDQLRGEAGRDRLWGDKGDDALDGGAGRDRLLGRRGDDRLFGGDHNDRLRGGRGDDLMSGGKGEDTFLFAADFGSDRVATFDANPAGGQDLIDLGAFGISAARFPDRVLVEDLGRNTRIAVDGDGEVLLRGVSGEGADTVDQDDFLL